jgi:hypothetical protein
MWSRPIAPGRIVCFRCTEEWLWADGPAGIVFLMMSALTGLGGVVTSPPGLACGSPAGASPFRSALHGHSKEAGRDGKNDA